VLDKTALMFCRAVGNAGVVRCRNSTSWIAETYCGWHEG